MVHQQINELKLKISSLGDLVLLQQKQLVTDISEEEKGLFFMENTLRDLKRLSTSWSLNLEPIGYNLKDQAQTAKRLKSREEEQRIGGLHTVERLKAKKRKIQSKILKISQRGKTEGKRQKKRKMQNSDKELEIAKFGQYLLKSEKNKGKKRRMKSYVYTRKLVRNHFKEMRSRSGNTELSRDPHFLKNYYNSDSQSCRKRAKSKIKKELRKRAALKKNKKDQNRQKNLLKSEIIIPSPTQKAILLNTCGFAKKLSMVSGGSTCIETNMKSNSLGRMNQPSSNNLAKTARFRERVNPGVVSLFSEGKVSQGLSMKMRSMRVDPRVTLATSEQRCKVSQSINHKEYLKIAKRRHPVKSTAAIPNSQNNSSEDEKLKANQPEAGLLGSRDKLKHLISSRKRLGYFLINSTNYSARETKVRRRATWNEGGPLEEEKKRLRDENKRKNGKTRKIYPQQGLAVPSVLVQRIPEKQKKAQNGGDTLQVLVQENDEIMKNSFIRNISFSSLVLSPHSN